MIEIVGAVAVARFVGTEVTLRCITGIATTAGKTIGLVKSIYSHSETAADIIKLLKNMDIEIKVKVLSSIVQNLKNSTCHTEALDICLESLMETLDKVHIELTVIHDHIVYNKTWRLLGSWRSYGFNENATKLEDLNRTLDMRKDLLFEVIKLNHNLPPSYESANK